MVNDQYQPVYRDPSSLEEEKKERKESWGVLNLLFWVGALKFRASDNSEAAPREVFVTMEERVNSFDDKSPKPPSW